MPLGLHPKTQPSFGSKYQVVNTAGKPQGLPSDTCSQSGYRGGRTIDSQSTQQRYTQPRPQHSGNASRQSSGAHKVESVLQKKKEGLVGLSAEGKNKTKTDATLGVAIGRIDPLSRRTKARNERTAVTNHHLVSRMCVQHNIENLQAEQKEFAKSLKLCSDRISVLERKEYRCKHSKEKTPPIRIEKSEPRIGHKEGLTQAVSAFTKDCDDLDLFGIFLDGMMRKLQSGASKLEESNKDISEKNSKLEDEVKSLTLKLKENQSVGEELELQLKCLECTVSELGENKLKLEEKNSKLEDEVKSLTLKLKENQSVGEELKRQLKCLECTVSELGEDKLKLEEKNSKLEDEVKSLTLKLKENQSVEEELNNRIKYLECNVRELNEKNFELSEDNLDLENKASNLAIQLKKSKRWSLCQTRPTDPVTPTRVCAVPGLQRSQRP